MKQLALVSLIVIALFGVFTTAISSENSGTVEVKVMPEVVVSISIPPEDSTVDFGTLPLSMADNARSAKASNVLSVMNIGSTFVDLSIQGTDATSSVADQTWSLSCTDTNGGTRGTVDVNQYVLRFIPNSSGDFESSGVEAICRDSGKSLATGVQPTNGEVEYMLQMNMPTGTNGYSQRTSTVTITATAQ